MSLKRKDPGLDAETIAACLDLNYGLRAAAIDFLPIGYDMNAAVYKLRARHGESYFLKIRRGPVNEAGLIVPRALSDLGVPNVLAPLPTRSTRLWCELDATRDHSVVLYPFIEGENAMVVGLSDDQWRVFGATLRAVHASGLQDRLRDLLPRESFALPSAALVRRLLASEPPPSNEAAMEFATVWREAAVRTRGMLARAEELGRLLQGRPFAHVLCHADIHAANILVGDDGRIYLIDWDGPLIAPIERDLLFVVGSRIARTVEPREETLFFAGYGAAEIDPTALIYYRYERIIEDIGEIANRLLLDATATESMRSQETELVMSFFAPGGDIDRAEDLSSLAAIGT
jgi:spectinomycin phosphotransferase